MKQPARITSQYRAPFGPVTFTVQDGHVINVELFKESSGKNPDAEKLPAVRNMKRYLDDYFSSRQPVHPKLFIQGTEFQKRVWEAMLKIPAGQTRTYGELARELNTGSRAVAQACRCNPLPLIIPCHRVVAANGIGGFMGKRQQVDVKRWLLAHEGVHVH
jgi:methylated-DNA-[protein]-cysteine S-methyltransferase